MSTPPTIKFRIAHTSTLLTCALAAVSATWSASARPADSNDEKASRLDRVVAVVNRQTILESDVEDEKQLAVLDPSNNGQEKISAQQALDQLISRTLIQQQIRQDDVQAAEPKPDEVAARVQAIRTQLPVCVHADCKSDQGWKGFLARHDLTPERVDAYVRNRIKILSFIEIRFRQGIRIAPEEIASYYREKLLPQYAAGEKAPPLDQISSRIEEILLEQKVNVLFDSWLTNLRKQGQIEVLDPALESSSAAAAEGATRE